VILQSMPVPEKVDYSFEVVTAMTLGTVVILMDPAPRPTERYLQEY
jgi:hypothetical protein